MQMRKTIFGATLVAALAAAAGHDIEATHSSAAVVLKWNQLLQSTLPQPGNPQTPRFYSMMHIAMFDAINAIEREFEPYRVRLRPGLGGSTEAAAAQAAHDVLVALNPSATAAYDEALAADLGDRPSEFVRRGAEIGAHIAKEILAWRQNDGWVVSAFPPYAEPPLPGRWQPTPPANAAATFTHLQHAAPMALLSATQVLPPPPPSLTSARYAACMLNNLRLHPQRAVLKSFCWEQEPLQRIPIAQDPPPPSSSTARRISSTWEQELSEGRNLRSQIGGSAPWNRPTCGSYS
jgi:hypothetical protein